MGSSTHYRDLFEARERLSPAELRFERVRRSIGLVLGPLAFAALALLRDGPSGRLEATLAWVLIWWITEAVPIPVTALLGPSLGVLVGVGSVKEMFAPFGDPVIFLFVGSFIIAEAMHSWGLDRRFACAILSRPSVGCSTTRVLIAFGTVTGLLSMWLSNTATTAMIYPCAMSVLVALARRASGEGREVDPTRTRYGTALMLATAYAASIGGIATPVGTAPNLIALGQLASLADVRISFFQWILLCGPLSLLMLAVLVSYLRWALPPEVSSIPDGVARAAEELAALGPWTPGQRNVLAAFGVTVVLWVLPGVLALVVGTDSPTYQTVQRHLPEGVVALVGASLLFVLPVSWAERRFTMSWTEAVSIDWGTLMLFGGGLSLGEAMFRTGLARRLGQALVGLTGARSIWSLSYLFAATAMVVTETTSNTAAVSMVCPLAIAATRAAGLSPVAPAVATAVASSMAFLLPVSTPPNAIVYGSGCVSITAMLRHGAVLDLVALAIGPAAAVLLTGAVLG